MIGNNAKKYICLCVAAGGVKSGVETVLGEVRSRRAKFVLMASDASDRTKKQLTDKCNYYGVKLIKADCTADELADVIGKKSLCAAVSFTGKGPSDSALTALEASENDAIAMTEDRKDDN